MYSNKVIISRLKRHVKRKGANFLKNVLKCTAALVLFGLLFHRGLPAQNSGIRPFAWSFLEPGVRKQAGNALVRDEAGLEMLYFENKKESAGNVRAFSLPVESVKNGWLRVNAQVRGENIGEKKLSWNGIKIMLKIDTRESTSWPQIELPSGSFGWRDASARFFIPENAVAVTLILGLENTKGKVWIKNLDFIRTEIVPAPPAVPRDKPVETGRGTGSLRGAMVHPTIPRDSFDVLTLGWKANLVRWQLIRSSKDSSAKAAYDAWLENRLDGLDEALRWAKENGTKVVVDLHSPPGGGASPGGYQDASGGLFTDPAVQDHFVEVWKTIASRYAGRTEIWGFDLANEPMDTGVADNCLDWNSLALRAGRAIREIDPDRTLIVECATGGTPAGFALLRPLPLDNVVYSFHMYVPGEFTHQGVFSPSLPVRYPGKIAGRKWNRDTLLAAMGDVIAFAEKYRVHIYVGEFGAIRWAPGAAEYLGDLVSIFESYGWDWSFHAFREWDGWSLEHGSSRKNTSAVGMTDRQKAIRDAFERN